jgi:hypothetical protein
VVQFEAGIKQDGQDEQDKEEGKRKKQRVKGKDAVTGHELFTYSFAFILLILSILLSSFLRFKLNHYRHDGLPVRRRKMNLHKIIFPARALRRSSLIAVLVFALGAAAYMRGVTTNPPGFYIDESSIAYNAYCISRSGSDEYGARWPLYFKAFGEYKNPTHIYLLAILFRLFGPSIFVARMLSAVAGLTTALLLGLLAVRLTGRKALGSIVAGSAMLTPWLFENSRTVFEVALYPLVLLLFLIVLHQACDRVRWGAYEIICLAIALALVTYTYSVGRLLGPLLALGLVLFASRRRWWGVGLSWLAYLVTLIPLFVFSRRHPGALTVRFKALTYIRAQSSLTDEAALFVKHYVGNISPWKLLVSGGSDLRDHVPGMGMLLAATLILASLGILLVIRFHRRNAWWQFILYGLAASVVPASLTDNEFPILRLVPFPVFLLVLTIPAWSYLWDADAERRKGQAALVSRPAHERRAYLLSKLRCTVLPALIVLTLSQGAIFQWLFHQSGPKRGYIFDSHYPRVLQTALSFGHTPSYLSDRTGASGYIQAYWYAALLGIDTARFIRLPAGTPPPDDALVISTEEGCSDCRLLLKSVHYIVYLSERSYPTAPHAPLPDDGYRTRLSLPNELATLEARQRQTVNVKVENIGNAVWSAYGEGDGKYAVTLHGLWLRSDQAIQAAQEQSASPLPEDLRPGQSVLVPLEVTAPASPGDYILEIDLAQAHASWFVRPSNLDEYVYERKLVQQEVTWFHERGAQPLRFRVQVIPSCSTKRGQ